MLLSGDLAQSTLGDVLGHLSRAAATGVLSLLRPNGSEHQIFMRAGSPRAVLSDGPRIGDFLSREAWLSEERLDRAIARQRAGDVRLLGELVCDTVEEYARVREGVRQQTKLRLEQLYAVTEARISFRSALFDDVVDRTWLRAVSTASALSPAEFLEGRPRARARRPEARDERHAALRLLGLDREASADAIRSAFKRLVLEMHPDRAQSEDDRLDRTARLARLTAAYQRLTS